MSGNVVSGVGAGTAVIAYTSGAGCSVMMNVTVNPLPAAITGAGSLCAGTTTTLSSSTGGGAWSSSNTSIAAMSGGTVSGISAGVAVITYALGTGCMATANFTVNATPSITGAGSVCAAATISLSSTMGGGIWSSSNPAVATVSGGLVSAIASGTVSIVYVLGTGCFSSATITVNALPPAITGAANICEASTTLYANGAGGGTWSSSNMSVAMAGTTTGIITGVTAGTADITYILPTGCMTTTVVTIDPLPAAITGTTIMCAGATTMLSSSTVGGTWSSSDISIAAAGSTTGIISGIAAGTATISYVMPSGCVADIDVTVNALPVVGISSTASCGNVDTLTASGATTYTWAPGTGLSCTTCAATEADPSVTTSYTVTGTDISGCTATDVISVNGDRIHGHITFSSLAPDTLDTKVWLIQYNPLDSTITALDSVMACFTDTVGYYEFTGRTPGNYMVKAKLVYGNPAGASGYIPTYSSSATSWNTAATTAHTSGSDILDIDMVYGTVPAGPGFIGGNVYSGAGKGTSDPGVSGMLILLENAASHVLTHTYTDGTGAYSFAGLAYGDYYIYPEEYAYNTTKSRLITIDGSVSTVDHVNFKQFLTSRVIVPQYMPVAVKAATADQRISIFPNPGNGMLNMEWSRLPIGNATVSITNVTGQIVYTGSIQVTQTEGNAHIDAIGLKNGVYQLTIISGHVNFAAKLVIIN